MPTHVTVTADLGRSPRQILELLTDQAFVQERTAINTTLAGRLHRHVVTDDEIVIETSAQMPAHWLPARVRAAAQVLPTITRRERWERATGSGTTSFDIRGVHASAEAQMSLSALPASPGLPGAPGSPGGARLTQTVTLTVSVPLVATLIEKALAGQVANALRAELPLYDSIPDRPGEPSRQGDG